MSVHLLFYETCPRSTSGMRTMLDVVSLPWHSYILMCQEEKAS